MHLELDNRKCSQKSTNNCFSNTNEAASFIAAAHIKADLRYPLVSVKSSKSFTSSWNFKVQLVRYDHNSVENMNENTEYEETAVLIETCGSCLQDSEVIVLTSEALAAIFLTTALHDLT